MTIEQSHAELLACLKELTGPSFKDTRAMDEAYQRAERAIANAETAKPHVCVLPQSIQEALNSGDGSYRP